MFTCRSTAITYKYLGFLFNVLLYFESDFSIMVKKYCVLCGNTPKHITVFGWPDRSPSIRNSWVRFVQLHKPQSGLPDSAGICQRHFKEDFSNWAAWNALSTAGHSSRYGFIYYQYIIYRKFSSRHNGF
jgi:hypothetical protein